MSSTIEENIEEIKKNNNRKREISVGLTLHPVSVAPTVRNPFAQRQSTPPDAIL
jgi:hypothetical protein